MRLQQRTYLCVWCGLLLVLPNSYGWADPFFTEKHPLESRCAEATQQLQARCQWRGMLRTGKEVWAFFLVEGRWTTLQEGDSLGFGSVLEKITPEEVKVSLPACNPLYWKISEPLHIQQVPIAIVLHCLSRSLGKSFFHTTNGAAPTLCSAWVDDLPWQAFIDPYLAQHGLFLQQDRDLWRLDSISVAQSSLPPTANKAEIVWHYFTFQRVEARDVLPYLQELRTSLQTEGSFHLFPHHNTMLIRLPLNEWKQVYPLLQALDQPVPQVQIEARIVSASVEAIEELGIRWNGQKRSYPASPHAHFSLQKGNMKFGVSAGWSQMELDLELAALQSENALMVVASPSLRTSLHKTASIKQGTEIPYHIARTTKGGEEAGQVVTAFREAVLGLEVTPRKISEDTLLLSVHMTHNRPDQEILQEDVGVGIQKQEIKTEVLVKEGDTVVLGGILQQEDSNQLNSIPFLSQVPWIGSLFQYRQRSKLQRELVIFLTPRWMKVHK